MADIIIMPKLGFNMSEGKLVEWYKAEGDAVKKGEPVFSVETDKTNMDIEATRDGVVRALLINAGDKIPVTLPIAVIGEADEDISAVLQRLRPSWAATAALPARLRQRRMRLRRKRRHPARTKALLPTTTISPSSAAVRRICSRHQGARW